MKQSELDGRVCTDLFRDTFARANSHGPRVTHDSALSFCQREDGVIERTSEFFTHADKSDIVSDDEEECNLVERMLSGVDAILGEQDPMQAECKPLDMGTISKSPTPGSASSSSRHAKPYPPASTTELALFEQEPEDHKKFRALDCRARWMQGATAAQASDSGLPRSSRRDPASGSHTNVDSDAPRRFLPASPAAYAVLRGHRWRNLHNTPSHGFRKPND